MKLYLHIGTNKTGSSFVQSLLVCNRAKLLSNGFFLPPSKWDDLMEEGKVSPGNGHEIAWYLHDKNTEKISAYLAGLKKEAEASSCHSIILSNEHIIRLFSDREIVQLLEKESYSSGIQEIHCLCVIRNVYEHALSLYKHRSKSRRAYSYQEWFEQDFETIQLFKKFLRHYDKSTVNWMFKKYEKNADYLEKVLFEEFIGVRSESWLFPEKRVINPSLSLDEIKLVSHLGDIGNRFLKELLTNKILNDLDLDHKDSLVLKKAFMKEAERQLKIYSSTINELDRLVDGKGIGVISDTFPHENKGGDSFSLSERHLKFLEEAIKESRKKSLVFLLRNQYRKFSQKPNKFDTQQFGGSLRPLD